MASMPSAQNAVSTEQHPQKTPPKHGGAPYDPYSDRRPEPEPLFERDPWG